MSTQLADFNIEDYYQNNQAGSFNETVKKIIIALIASVLIAAFVILSAMILLYK